MSAPVRGRKSSPCLTPARRGRKKTPPPVAALVSPGPGLAAGAAAGTEPRYTALLSHELPLVLSAVNNAHLELGLAVVVVARRIGQAVVCAHFVIDLLASGVTDCYGQAFTGEEFEKYLGELDERVPLQSCPPEVAARIVQDGVGLGERHGMCPPESLEAWSLLLPAPSAAASPIAYQREGAWRPLAVAEVLPFRVRGEGTWLGEDDEIRCVVRVEGRREH